MPLGLPGPSCLPWTETRLWVRKMSTANCILAAHQSWLTYSWNKLLSLGHQSTFLNWKKWGKSKSVLVTPRCFYKNPSDTFLLRLAGPFKLACESKDHAVPLILSLARAPRITPSPQHTRSVDHWSFYAFLKRLGHQINTVSSGYGYSGAWILPSWFCGNSISIIVVCRTKGKNFLRSTT